MALASKRNSYTVTQNKKKKTNSKNSKNNKNNKGPIKTKGSLEQSGLLSDLIAISSQFMRGLTLVYSSLLMGLARVARLKESEEDYNKLEKVLQRYEAGIREHLKT